MLEFINHLLSKTAKARHAAPMYKKPSRDKPAPWRRAHRFVPLKGTEPVLTA
jgi:hypothetical protein